MRAMLEHGRGDTPDLAAQGIQTPRTFFLIELSVRLRGRSKEQAPGLSVAFHLALRSRTPVTMSAASPGLKWRGSEKSCDSPRQSESLLSGLRKSKRGHAFGTHCLHWTSIDIVRRAKAAMVRRLPNSVQPSYPRLGGTDTR